MKPVLVTAFGPFADVERNPSADLLAELLRRRPLASELLAVEYESAGRKVEELIETHRPRIALLLGVARRAETARFETVARNVDDCETRDNQGCLRSGEVIVPGGVERLETGLPHEWLARIRAAGLEIETSDDAGGFLCNHVFYRARSTIERLGLRCACGFLHLPDHPLDRRWAQVLEDLL